MGKLFVVRHGQASFFEEDYDQLSPLGIEQSRLLGLHWAAQGLVFDRVYAGPRRRQQETARRVGEELVRAKLPWPEVVELSGLDEYAAEDVLKQALPGLIEQSPEIRELHQSIAESTDRTDHLRRFQRLYEVVIRRWAAGEWELAEIEPWSVFCKRTEAAWQFITDARQGGKRVAAFTSGGPVGAAVSRALGAGRDQTLEVAWMVRNASYSEFLYSGDRFTLSTFNSFPHLPLPSYWTYR